MRWFGSKNGSRDDPVHVVQHVLSEQADMSLHSMIDALDAIVCEQRVGSRQAIRVLRGVRDRSAADRIGRRPVPPRSFGATPCWPMATSRTGQIFSWNAPCACRGGHEKLVNDEGFEGFKHGTDRYNLARPSAAGAQA